MSYLFLVKDQLTTFLCSLQDLLAAKHDVTKETLPTKIDILMSDGLAEEVAREKLELSPNFKVEEYGLQLRFYQEDRVIGIKGYCLKNFSKPDCSSDARWGKVSIPLASFRKNEVKLNKGLERRQIKMGLSTAYIRKIARNKEGKEFECSYIRAGGGFTDNHWHDEIDVEHIIHTRIEQQKQVKIAGKKSDGDLENSPPYCGKLDAFVEYETAE